MDENICVLGHLRLSQVCQLLFQLAWVFCPFFFPVFQIAGLIKGVICSTNLASYQAASWYQQSKKKSQTNTALPKDLPGGDFNDEKWQNGIKGNHLHKICIVLTDTSFAGFASSGDFAGSYLPRTEHRSDQKPEARSKKCYNLYWFTHLENKASPHPKLHQSWTQILFDALCIWVNLSSNPTYILLLLLWSLLGDPQ